MTSGVLLIGANGAGKSSLINAVIGLVHRPDTIVLSCTSFHTR